MAGESVHFGLRERPPTSAVRPFDLPPRLKPMLDRAHSGLAELGGDQREAALALLRESMSASGYRSAKDVMKLNEHALEITGKPDEYGEWFYWVSIFGTPSPGEPWGWQIDGHHLNVNCFVL